MVNVRIQTDPRYTRFNLLLTEDRPRANEDWTSQFPRLLEPLGVVSYVARSGREAIALADRLELHAAVIDLGTPPEADLPDAPETPEVEYDTQPHRPLVDPADLWLRDLFRRLKQRSPVVVIHNAAYSQRKTDRLLREAIRLGAFSVLGKPVSLEQLLAVFQRLMDRAYGGTWPGQG